MQFRKREPKKIAIEMTPLIDVVFLLLIFFMVSTTFKTESGIKLKLPKAKTGGVATAITPIEVSLNSRHQVFIGKEKIAGNQLLTKLKELNASGPKPLLIRADGTAQHKAVVFIMDVATEAGIEKISIATIPR
ncbi:MAG: biopolymer transporter ExbD [SAR324 cluster bacterium]|nr:biopolymer transporter ExbD [SAR324 cluster bacterium]